MLSPFKNREAESQIVEWFLPFCTVTKWLNQALNLSLSDRKDCRSSTDLVFLKSAIGWLCLIEQLVLTCDGWSLREFWTLNAVENYDVYEPFS